MANEEQLKILKAGVSGWNEWRAKNRKTVPDLSKAYLREANLREANLNEANLLGADLLGADLSVAKLSGAILHGADLRVADLSLADLRDADLSLAKLNEVNLSVAILGRADLKRADLRAANLRDADLDKTSFAEAILFHTIFAVTSLKTAKGLDTCKHVGPSVLDYHTLMNSGPLPEVFLRGCGLSDSFIDYLPSFWNEPIEFYSCFISYSHADKSFARRLHDALQGRGIRCWLDEHQLLPGDKLHRAVDEGIRLWDKVLLCCSKDSLTSWWVDKEVEKALLKEEKLSKERGQEILALIPLNLDGQMFKPEWQDWKKDHLTSRLAPDFTGWEKDNAKFEAQLEKVIKALRADAKARERPPKPRL